MNDSLKFIYDNYTRASGFNEYWYAFENYLDLRFPPAAERESFLARLKRFEDYLMQVLVHETFWRRIYRSACIRDLAELQPRVFRENTGDTSAHDAFASDFSRFTRGQKPKEPIARVLNLLYTVRCNVQHGQKPLPDEWEEIRKRNELVFSLTIPIIAKIDELVIALFIAAGIFSYGTLQEALDDQRFPYSTERLDGFRIKGHLFDLGIFPAWRYETWGWVHGCILRVPTMFRLKHLAFCDEVEGERFERRLALAYGENDQPQHIVWAYHYREEPRQNDRISNGLWKGSNKREEPTS